MNMGLINRSYESDETYNQADIDDGGVARGNWPKIGNLVAGNNTAAGTDTTKPTNSSTQWQRFGRFVEYLNDRAATNEPDRPRYVVLYMGRHGEGYHNVAERMYGTEEWDVSYVFCILHLGLYFQEKDIECRLIHVRGLAQGLACLGPLI